MRSLVTGAGGFVGGHLVRALLERGDQVRAADIKPASQWKQLHREAGNWDTVNLAEYDSARRTADDCEVVYHLAADVGGMGYIAYHHADCMLNILADTNVARAALAAGARMWYASSACVYPLRLQTTSDAPLLAEDDAYPADPEDGYGWEKLFAERMLAAFAQDYGMEVRIGRYQSVYGPNGVYDGGREKAPTAICRKVAIAKLTGAREIEVWGDGTATRTFTYVDDAVAATLAITAGSYNQPLNVGSPKTSTVDQLVAVVEDIAGYKVARKYVDGPVGVQGRASDNTRVTEIAGWKPQVSFRDGMERTYAWVYNQVSSRV